MKTRITLWSSILLLMSGNVAAAVVDVYVSGIITFDREVIRNPDLPQSVVDSILTLLPDGSSLSAHLVVDTETPDASPDPGIGDYQGAVSMASFLVNGFFFPLDAGFCNPDLDCKLKVENDYLNIPGGDLDRISMSAPVLSSLELGEAVSAESGIVPGFETSFGFFPVDPLVSGNLGLFEVGFDLVDSNVLFDPLTAPFDQGAFSIFFSNAWVPSNTSGLTQLGFNLDSVQISNSPPAVVPLPATVWLFGTALIGLAGFRNRRKAA